MNNFSLILKYFPQLRSIQISQFEALENLYKDWNLKINVISRKDIEALYLKHVLHSLGIAKVIKFKSGTKILDVGTGGGFPGVPLAILFPDCEFQLVDSINKKLIVIKDVVNTLGLKNVTTTHSRVEQLKGTFDFIVSRAVTTMPVFVNWVQPKVSPIQKNVLSNGILYLKGGDLTAELKPFKEALEFNLSNYFEESFFNTKKVVYLPLS